MTTASQPATNTDAIDGALVTAFGHLKAGRLQEAEAIYRDVLAARPDHADANHYYGLVALQVGRNDIAAARIGRAIAVDGRKAIYHQNLGCALKALGRLDDAVSAFRRALALRPDYADAHYNLGNALHELGRFEEAVTAYRAALEIEPDSAKTHNNLGSTLKELCRFEESVAAYRRALDGGLDGAETHHNLADSLLAMSCFEEGWREYEYRPVRPLPVAAPAWDGGALDGKTILVHSEQGVGDEILFASCLPDLIARAGHCVIECELRLERLFARSFPTSTVYGAHRDDTDWLAMAPPIDVQVRLASLMRHLRPNIDSFPDHHGYLLPDPVARKRFADRLAALGPGPKVGISWRSMRGSRWHDFYTALDEWREIFGLPGVHFVNLQYDDSGPEVAEVNERLGVHVHDFADLDLLNDLDGVAALVATLDLVIAPANAVTALAGALGAPLWIFTPELNWCMFGTDAYPWFPDATVYRRTADMADWGIVLARVARDLAALIAAER